jgi:mannose-6-phosphate isomerase-like protein (cupin superfamily)
VAHTHKNLKEVEDSARAQGMPDEMEARFARGDLDLEQSAMSIQKYGPNFRQPFAHKHGAQEEVYVVLNGGGRMKIDDEIIEVAELDAIRLSPEAVRCIEAGPEGIELLMFSPSEGQNDAEIVKDPDFWKSGDASL